MIRRNPRPLGFTHFFRLGEVRSSLVSSACALLCTPAKLWDFFILLDKRGIQPRKWRWLREFPTELGPFHSLCELRDSGWVVILRKSRNGA